MSDNQSSSVKIIMLFSAIIVALFIQLVEWDRHFISVIPLQIKDLVGMSSKEDLRELVQICRERMKHSCVERKLTALVQKENQDAKIAYELGEIRRKTGDYAGAFLAYQQHFSCGGTLAEAAYELAKLHAKFNEIDKAKTFFDFALSAKPGVLQVTVIQTYVNFLVQQGKLIEAKAVIEEARKQKGPNAIYFMAKELDKISKSMRRI